MRGRLGHAAILSVLVVIAACTDNVAKSDTAPSPGNGFESKLSAAQRSNLDQFNFERFERDYATLRRKLVSETPNNTLPAARDMNFNYLDNDGDGALSATEYGIWKFAADRGDDEPTSGNLRDNKVQEVITSFLYYDRNGSGTLSEEEFVEGRREVERLAP